MVGADGGIPPIDVILHHMRWYHEQAEAVYKKVQVASKLVKDQKTLKRFMALLEELGDYRQLAIAAAEKAAPYCHHRLAAIAVNNDTPMETILDVNMTIASPMAVLDEQDRVENATIIDARPDLSTT
jgi:hypothetical protein